MYEEIKKEIKNTKYIRILKKIKYFLYILYI